MDRLVCQRFVSLYMLTECLTVGMTARINSAAPRTNWGIILYVPEGAVVE